MQNKAFRKFYILACIGLLILSFYPLWMGAQVITDMIVDGTVMKENYPKYIIPYTPISIAVLIGTLTMPLFIMLNRRFSLIGGTAAALAAFSVLEALFEQKVVVTSVEMVTKLEHWQMFMCATFGVRETYRTQSAIDILIGNYNPAFKLHFYMISIVLILTILNCLYGFAQMIVTGNHKRKKSLILQSVATATFLCLCILACFTAFWRDGSLQVSPLSASLMAIFFILLGVTVGIYAGSFLLKRRPLLSVWLPAILASVHTLAMYIGEMILLNGHVYSFGQGLLFQSIPGVVLSPVDLLIIVTSGGITAVTFMLLHKRSKIHP